MKIDPTPLPPSFYKPEPVDPRHAIMEARFKELVRKNEESKHKNEHGGLAGLLKPKRKFIWVIKNL